MPETEPIRLIIADDHALVRSGVKTYLQSYPHIQLLGEADDGNDAIQLCEMVNPQVVLIDAHMPGMDGISAARVIHQRWPEIGIIMLLSDLSDPVIEACKDCGAIGVLSKNVSPAELAQAIEDARTHKPVTPSEAGRAAPQATPSSDQSLSKQTMLLELEMAGRIQNKILPEKPPVLEGWDISAALEPAYETSGDFYDFIPLAYGKLGIVIGDVANKGLGAAIFMAMCSSLIRTYATHFPIMPGMMINAVNERLNADTRTSMFVTTFYGVLDPKLNRLIYVNAGHNPPILVSNNKGKPVDQFSPTGPALGIFDKSSWTQKLIKFSPGDVLLLYTDGITESQNPQGDFFGEQRLLSTLRSQKDRTADQIQKAVLKTVTRFTGNAPRHDDIAMIVIRRDGK